MKILHLSFICFSRHILSGKSFFYLLFIMPLFSWAQEYSLSGVVRGVDNVPIQYANVILQDKDSVAVEWGLTDKEGNYAIENIKPASYILKVSLLGYKANATGIAIYGDLSDQITVLEEEVNELDEVVLEKPRIEEKLGRWILNVQNTTLSDGSTWEAVTQAPYLFKTGDEVLVKGRVAPLFFINDRRVYLSVAEIKQLLESTPANTLKSVEVMLNPPAKYEAEGKAVVNIVMSKNLSIGYNGNVSARYTQGVFPKHLLSTGHFYKTEKVNLYAGYSNNYRKRHQFFRDEITFFTDDVPSGNWLSETWRITKQTNHTINTNIDYDINENHSIGLSGIGSFIPNNRGFYGSDTNAVDSLFYSVNRSTYVQDKLGLSLHYRYDLGENKELTANVHYTNYNYDRDQNITTDYMNSADIFMRNSTFTNDKDQSVKIYSSRLDYTADTKKNGTFGAGIRWSYITFDNRIEQRNIEGDNIDLYDRFLYDETTFSGYLSYDKSWDNWYIRLGVRGENTLLKGVSLLESEINDQNYFKLFPNIYVRYKTSKNHRFSFSYRRGITRPRFEKLNPFRIYSNDNSYITGNPRLLPTLSNTYIFNYMPNGDLTFQLYSLNRNDPISQLPYIDNEENELVYRQENLDKSTEYGLDISWNKTITPWWYLRLFSSVYYRDNAFFATQNDNEVLNLNKWMLLQSLGNNFTFSKDKTFSGELALGYSSQSPEGNAILGRTWNIDIGFQKTLWKKKATLSFYARDIFNRLAYTSETRYLDQYISSYSDFEYRTFEFRFTYKFGNYGLKTNKKSIRESELNRL